MSFADIKLQDKAIQFLKRSLRNKRVSHSLLFIGPESVGKGLCALTLAKTLNCEREDLFDSCGTCLSCKKIDNRNHPDVKWIEPEGAGNVIKIEKIKSMRDSINLKPFEGRAKVFIIDRSHLLTEEAANSILKTLEEPPKDSFIILITNDVNRIFPTLRSRCQWVIFSSAGPEDLKRFLMDEYNLIETHAHFLSHLSEGRIGRAVSMKDEETLDWKNTVLNRFSKEAIIFKEDSFFFDNRREKILDIMDTLISWYRDIFILKNGGDGSLVVNVDRIGDLQLKAASFSHEKIKEILSEAIRMRTYIAQNVNPKLALSNLACRIE